MNGRSRSRRKFPPFALLAALQGQLINIDYHRVSHIQPQKLRWLTYHGAKRHEVGSDMGSKDVVLTTYETLRSDRTKRGPLFRHEWERIILDEGSAYSKSLIFYNPFS